MARGKAISVKIATHKVITALETALAKLESDYAKQAESDLNFKLATEKWEKDVQALVFANISKVEDFSASTNYRNELRVNFSIPAGGITLPEEPQREVETMHQWQYSEKREELSNAIRILKMTDEEVVNTSTYNAVARYL